MEHLAATLFLLLRLLTLISALAKSLDPPRYDTAYACEGKILKIECRDAELIQLIRANYGRFSITICNDHGNTEWSVNCMSPKSLRVLHSKCAQQQNCSIPANTSLFGDPCPGTLKYLEAHYRCIPATTTTTTSRPSPPWLIASQPSVWSTAKLPTIRPQSHPHSRGSNSSPENSSEKVTSTTAGTVSKSAVPREPPPTTRPPAPPPPYEDSSVDPVPYFTVTPSPPSAPAWKTSIKPAPLPGSIPDYTDYIPSPTVSWTPEGDFLHFCPPITARNLQWNWTRAGEMSIQPCPEGAAGLARWRCTQQISSDMYSWSGTSPDLSECRSLWLTSLDSRIEEGDSITSIANDLSQVTRSKTLYGGDMMTTTTIVQKMSERMAKNIQTFPDPQQREAYVTELLQSVVRTASNLLDSSQYASWKDLNHKEQMQVATSLLIGLEKNAFLLADTVIREKTVIQREDNILLSVNVMEIKNVKSEERFPNPLSIEQRPDYSDWLEVPRNGMVANGEGDLVRLVFIAFERLEEILQPLDLTSEDLDGEMRKNTTRVVNTKVISASLGPGRHIKFNELGVRLCLKHIRTENVSNPACVYWDYVNSVWSTEGCQIESTNKTHTICQCNHLTNFAVLMDVHATYLPPSHQMALQIITYIGCIVSIVCLFLAVLTFQLFRGLKSDRTTIHKNLCMCLLLAEVLFILGISQTDKPIVCGVVAGLLHFVFLCAFAWMFLEGFQLYVMLIEVFEAEKSRIRWYYMFAYGAPLVIVCVSCVVDPLSYGTDRYCWLRADNFFIFSFVGPVIAVILANLVFLSMAIYMMCRHSNASVSMKSKEHSRLASARAWLRGAIVLVFLLGLTWTFGLLYLSEESVVMAYIFTILNSLQGLFIFLFHCFQNDKVRKEYRKWNSWLPKCVKCKKYSNSNGTSSKERRSSVYGASHGTNSASNSHTHSTGVGDVTTSLPNGNSSKIYFKSQHNPMEQVHYGSDPRSNYIHGVHGHHGSLQHDVTLTSLHSVSLNLHGHESSYADRVSTLRSLHGDSDIRKQQYRHGADRVLVCELERQPHGSRAATLQLARRRRDHYGDDGIRRGDGDDPVYEEIRQAASDASDEELRRGVASRQSLRSYGDHSPLIPSPHAPPDASRPHGTHSQVVPDPHGFLYAPRSHALPLDR